MSPAAARSFPNALAIFLGAAILWNLFFRCSQDVSVSFLDDVWARSLVTVFASPLKVWEFAAAIMLLGLVKLGLTLLVMAAAAWFFYAFDLFTYGFALVPFIANLVMLGWTVGLISLALILRFGGRWGILAWSLPVLLMPFASVFYPESVLPRSRARSRRRCRRTTSSRACGPRRRAARSRGGGSPSPARRTPSISRWLRCWWPGCSGSR